MDYNSNRSDLLCVDSDQADTRDKRKPLAEPPQTALTDDNKSNFQESFSTQVLEYYKSSAGQEIVSEVLQSQSIGQATGGSLGLGKKQQTLGLGLGLGDVGLLGLGLSLESDDKRNKLLLVELGDDKPWDAQGLQTRPSPITSDEIITIPRKNIPKHESVHPELGSRPVCSVNLGVALHLPRERKKWVKPPLFEHSSGSDDIFDGHLLSKRNSLDYQRNFASRHIGQQTENKHHSTTLGLPHQTQTIDNFLETPPNVVSPNVTLTEDRTRPTEHEGSSNESRSKSALDSSLDASGFRPTSPSSSIASNKRGLEWDSGADVGYHYPAKDSEHATQISSFERIALARGSGAYQLTSDVKQFLSLNCQLSDIQTELSPNLEQSQMTETHKGGGILKKYNDGNGAQSEMPSRKSYQRTERHVQTFPPKHVSDVKAYRPLHNSLSKLDVHKLVSGGVASKLIPPHVREEISTETSEEELTLKQDSHREHTHLLSTSPLAQSTPLDCKENKTKERLQIETKRRQAEEIQNNNRGSSYFSKKFTTPEFSFIPQESESVGKMSDLHKPSNRKEKSDRNENDPSNVQTFDRPTVQNTSNKNSNKLEQSAYFPALEPENISDQNAHSNSSPEKPTPVFCVEQIEEVIKNIQRKATKHQEHIDKFVKQTNTQQVIPHTFPRTRREESSSRDSSTHHQWDQGKDQRTNERTSQHACSADCKGAHKKTGTRSESTNSLSPQLNEDGTGSSASSCYFSDTPQPGNGANERGTVGSTGSFEYLPGHVYEKTNIRNLDAQSKLNVQRRNGSTDARKPSSLQEDLKVWAQLCQDDVVNTKDVVNQIVQTNYLEDEDDEINEIDVTLQTGCSETGTESDKPTEELSAGNLTLKHCDKGTQISTIFSTASSDVESNTSSRRPKEEETSESCCEQGRADGTSSATFSSAGYNTSTSRSFSNCEAADWRKPATQSEQEFESRNLSHKKHKAKHGGSQNERLAMIDKKINHLNNLKMILERQDKLKKSLGLGMGDEAVPLPKHQSVYTVMTVTVDVQSEEVDENETAVKELVEPRKDILAAGPPSESSLEVVKSDTNWASHHQLLPRNTREISTQVPSSVSLNVLKEQNTNAARLKGPKGENKLTNGKREICTQTSSRYVAVKSSDAESTEGATNQGTVNVYVQTVEKDHKQTKITTAEPMCCCQCEENLSIIKERARTLGLNAKQSSSSESCPVSCNCKCHHKRKGSSLPKSGPRLNNVTIPVSKSPEPQKENTLPVTVSCNCKKLTTSTPISTTSSTCNDSAHRRGNSKDRTSQQVVYRTPIRPVAIAKPPVECPRNATRNTATSTVDNKGVQTSDSVSQLPIIRPLWFSTSNSHVKIRGKKCVCCSRQPVKNANRDSEVIFEENCRSQKSSRYKRSTSRSEDVRCPHNSSTSGSRPDDVRCPHVSSTYKSSSEVMSKCQRCRQNVKVCQTPTSEDSWDMSAVSGSTASKTDNRETVKTPRPVGYVITFETVAAEQSSSVESVRKRSLQEVKVKIPAARLTTTHKKERTKLKTSDELPRERSLQEVRVQVPSRRTQHRREEKPTEILNSNRLADNLGEANSKQDILEEAAMKSSPEKKTKPSLQDYLRQARPDYIKMAEARRRCLAELADLRLIRHENRQRLLALASQPGSVIDTDTLSSANSLLPPPPMAIKRVFNQRVMRRQTERGYQKCPEVVNKKVDRKRKEDYRTNRLMAEIFTKKLQKKALRGDVNLSNSVSVISIL